MYIFSEKYKKKIVTNIQLFVQLKVLARLFGQVLSRQKLSKCQSFNGPDHLLDPIIDQLSIKIVLILHKV